MGLIAIGLVGLAAFRKQSSLMHVDVLLALGAGLFAACLLQITALGLFGLGSAYAVKKHGFLLGTAAVMIWSALIVEFGWARKLVAGVARRVPKTHATLAIVPLTMIGLLLVNFVGRPHWPLHPLSEYERQLSEMLGADRILAHEMRGATLSANHKLPLHQNFSVAMRHLRPSHAIVEEHHQAMVRGGLGEGVREPKYVVVSEPTDDVSAACVRNRFETIAVLKGSCYRP
jgi:hypothetical protein